MFTAPILMQFGTSTGLWLDALRTSALWVEWEPIAKKACHDFKDEKFIEAALTAGCHTIIARDQNLTVVEKPFGIDMHTPREWLDTLSRPQRRRLH
jgi:predicted nucleic acid-binding protein